MKKLLTLLLLAVGMTAAAGTMKTITVDNEADFLRALGGNRIIKIADNTRLNLSTILEYEDLCLDVQIPFVDYGEIPTGIKEMLSLCGIQAGPCRLPNGALTPAQKEDTRKGFFELFPSA